MRATALVPVGREPHRLARASSDAYYDFEREVLFFGARSGGTSPTALTCLP